MRKTLLWLGALLCGVGIAVIAASAVTSYMGLNASFNLGDPTNFEFVLIPFCQVWPSPRWAWCACWGRIG